MGWYAVYRREMLLMKKKIGKFGHVFSSVLFPIIYLFAFGMGLGSRVDVQGGYVPFLAKGILGVTVMMNAFQQTSLSVSVSRLHFRTFQTVIMSPVSPVQIGLGIVLAGVTRGVLMGAVLYSVAYLTFDAPGLSSVGMIGMVLSAFCFAALGLAIGLWVSDPDEISLVNNFIITPMTFFLRFIFPDSKSAPCCQSYCLGIAAELSKFTAAHGFLGIVCDRARTAAERGRNAFTPGRSTNAKAIQRITLKL